MKLLWIDLNSSYSHSSLALPAIHAQMPEDSEIQWVRVSVTINENVGMIVEKIFQHKPDILAGTLWLFNHEIMLHICSRLRALLPKSIIVLGGPEFLGDNVDFLEKNQCVDCVFRGEGEESFPLWLKFINDKSQWSSIMGLCYLDDNKNYVDGGIARVIDFSALNPPECSEFFNWSKPFVQLETTRGCFNTCSFCVSGGEKPVRNLDMSQIKERLEEIQSHGIYNVRVLDRTFNYDTTRAKELFSLFMEFPEIQYHLEIHPALLSPALRAELVNLPKGLLHLEAGIQSLREDVLKISMRKGKLSAALDGLEFLCSLDNMITHTDLIAGLPLYTLDQIYEDVIVLARLGADEIQLESLKLLPGTVMRRDAKHLGIVYSPYPPYEVLHTNEISISELQEARLLSRLLDAFYNCPTWQSLTRKLILSDDNFLRHFLDYLTRKEIIDNPISLENRGLILYNYCSESRGDFIDEASCAWIEAGMSLKKAPALKVTQKHFTIPQDWEIIYGEYRPELRLTRLPGLNGKVYWFGHSPTERRTNPIFKAISADELSESSKNPPK